MAEAYVGEIRIFAGNYAPKDWALCNGQLMSVQQNTPLFSLLGTIYGGDGKTNFGLPNLMGKSPMHAGTGVGLTPRGYGDEVGENEVNLLISDIPVHTHAVRGTATIGTTDTPSTEVVWSNVAGGFSAKRSYSDETPSANMNPLALQAIGGSQPHNNKQPYTGLNFIICLSGNFPPRP